MENNLPTLPTGDELEARARNLQFDEVRKYLLDARENYPEPYYLLEYKGVPFSTLGGIQALSGQKKNGKTFVLAQLMAAILGTGTERVTNYLSGLRVPERTIEHLGHKPTVLYVDTEMEKLNSAKVLRRVHWLCDWPMDEPDERFHVLWLRGITDEKNEEGKTTERAYEKRYRIIKLAIEMLHPDAVFIDGIRDIIGDFNDNAESAALVSDLMALAEREQICIWNTLHMNPRPGNDDESKMRGHLGTELGNKITDTLVSIKKKGAAGDVTFTVKQQDARGKDMEDWMFSVTESAGALGIPKILTATAPTQPVVEVDGITQDILIEIDHALAEIVPSPGSMKWSEIRNALKEYMHIGSTKAGRYIEAAISNEILSKPMNGRYTYQGLNKLPFTKPEDNDDVPF